MMAPAVSCHALMRLSPLLRLLAVARLWPPAVVQDRQILNAAPSLNSRAMMGWTDGITITRYDTKIPQKCQV